MEVIPKIEEKKVIINMTWKMMIQEEEPIALNIQLNKPMLRNIMKFMISKMIKKVKLLKIWNIRTTLRVKQNLMKIQMKLIILNKNL